jgi:hypothetical protein
MATSLRDPTINSDPAEWGPTAEPWVRRKPAVSFVFAGHCQNAAIELGALGFRTASIEPYPSPIRVTRNQFNGLSQRSDGPQTLITAVIDTCVTIIEACSQTAAGLDGPVATGHVVARAIGQALALKDGYHVILHCGVPGKGEPSTLTALSAVVAEIETASGKSLGPDFGLCRDDHALDCGVSHCVVFASDRRAAVSVRPIYEALGRSARFMPLDLDEAGRVQRRMLQT